MSSFETELWTAAHEGNLRMVEYWLAAGADINFRDAEEGQTPLIAACNRSHPEIAAYLIDAGADILLRDNGGYDALCISANDVNMLDVIKKLLELKADPTLRNNYGEDSFDRAKRYPAILAVMESLPPVFAPEEVCLQRKLGNKVLQDIFNFAERECITLIRPTSRGAVEAMSRRDFADIKRETLKEAFDAYAKKGGTILEEDVFPDALVRKSKPGEDSAQPRGI